MSSLKLPRPLALAGPRARSWLKHRHEVRAWNRRAQQGPLPARFKHAVLRQYARDSGIRRFVESGTYRGDTVAAVQDGFDMVISVELDDALYEAARRRFDAVAHVEILQGDSGQLMPQIVERLDAPTLYWLDGHYSAGVTARGIEETPILRELDAILGGGRRGDVILVDDARCFTGDGGWPSVEDLRHRVRSLQPELVFDVRDDIIRIHATPELRSSP